MRRSAAVALLTLILLLVGAAPAAAVTLDNGVVFEFRQTTAAVYEQGEVSYEAMIRNESTQNAGFGRLELDVPPGFRALQYLYDVCRPYADQTDIYCDTWSLAPGEQLVLTFVYTVLASSGDYPVNATLNLYWDLNPPPPVTLSVVTSVQPSAELQVAWSQLSSGGDIVRRATVRSFGPSTAVGVVLTITWQSRSGTAQPLSLGPSQGACDPPTESSARCVLGALAVYGTATVDVVFRRRVARGLATTAQVTSDTHDVDPSTNTATLQS
jgi:hypothetical protein